MLTTMSKYKRKAKIQANYKVRKNAGGRSRTDMDYKARRILNPVRLPVSPLRHIILDKSILFYHIYNLIARKKPNLQFHKILLCLLVDLHLLIRSLLIVRKLHRMCAATLRHRTESCSIFEHFSKRDLCINNFRLPSRCYFVDSRFTRI